MANANAPSCSFCWTALFTLLCTSTMVWWCTSIPWRPFWACSSLWWLVLRFASFWLDFELWIFTWMFLASSLLLCWSRLTGSLGFMSELSCCSLPSSSSPNMCSLLRNHRKKLSRNSTKYAVRTHCNIFVPKLTILKQIFLNPSKLCCSCISRRCNVFLFLDLCIFQCVHPPVSIILLMHLA